MEKATRAAPIRTILGNKASSSAFALTNRRAANFVGWMIGTRLLCAASAFSSTTIHGHVWDGGVVSIEVGW
jgi:hypothetical protein